MKIQKFTACAIAMLTAVSCSSAKNSGSDKKNENSIKKISVSDSGDIYKKSALPMPNDISSIIDIHFDEKSGNIFVTGMDSSGAIKCFITDSDFSMYRPVDLHMESSGSDKTVLIDICGDKIYAATCSFNESGSICRLSIRGTDGSIISDSEIDTGGAVINSLVCNENGIFIGTGEICMKVDDSGNILQSSENGISSVIDFSDGRIAGTFSGKGSIIIRELDTKTLEISGSETELPENVSGAFITGNADYSAFIINNSAVFGMKSSDSIERKIDLVSSGLNGIKMICPLSDGDFIAADSSGLIRLSVRDIAEIGDISEVTVAVTRDSDSISSAISEFNANSTRFRIKLEDYSEGMEYSIQGHEMAFDNLHMDVISGKNPDMVYLDTNETALLTGIGAFTDLYEFMDSDTTFTRDAFLSNYLEACETDGKFYSIEPTFMIQTIGAKKKYVGTSDWSLDDFRSTYGNMPDGMDLFESGNNEKAVLSFLTNDGNSFVDHLNFTCNFDSDEFIGILEFADQFPSVDEYDFELRSCRNDTALLSIMYCSSFRDINKQVQGTFGNEEVSFAGFPTNSGEGSKMLLNRRFSIMEKSQNKEGAWEFITSLLDDSHYSSMSDGIPVTEKGLEIVAESALEKPYFVENSGEKIYINETFTDWNTGQEIVITPMTPEDKERYLEFVRSIKSVTSSVSNSMISSIISEETDIYFAGEYTSSQTADMIQNRISIMLSEAA